MPRPASDRRTLILDTAIDVIANHGLRGLTHRAIDRAAELPEGSTSAYYRTRRALQLAAVLRTTELLHADVNAVAESILADEADREKTSAAVESLFHGWLQESSLLLARIELTIEAARDPELARPLTEERERVVGLIAHVINQLGLDRGEARAETVVSALDGVLIGGLLRTDAERAAFLANAVRIILDEVAGASALD